MSGQGSQQQHCEDKEVKMYRLYYELAHNENKPNQSNFVSSSTHWSREDSKWWYESQIFGSDLYKMSGPLQDKKISTSKQS